MLPLDPDKLPVGKHKKQEAEGKSRRHETERPPPQGLMREMRTDEIPLLLKEILRKDFSSQMILIKPPNLLIFIHRMPLYFNFKISPNFFRA